MPRYHSLLIVDTNIKRRDAVALVLTTVGGLHVQGCSFHSLAKLTEDIDITLVSIELDKQIPQDFRHPIIWYGESEPVNLGKRMFVRWDPNHPPNFAELTHRKLREMES